MPIDYVFLPTVQARDFYKVEIKCNIDITLLIHFSEGVTLLSVYFVKVLLFLFFLAISHSVKEILKSQETTVTVSVVILI